MCLPDNLWTSPRRLMQYSSIQEKHFRCAQSGEFRGSPRRELYPGHRGQRDARYDSGLVEIRGDRFLDLSQLSDEQLNDLLTRLFQLKKNLDEMAPVGQLVDQDGKCGN